MNERAAPEHLAPATVDTRRVLAVAAGVLLFLAASMAILAWVFFVFTAGNRTPAPKPFPQPQLQVHGASDLKQLLSRQRAELNSYRWTDASHDFIAIPIERAMEIVAARGPQGYQPIAPPRPAPSAQPKPEAKP
jgi:hypothetical protein